MPNRDVPAASRLVLSCARGVRRSLSRTFSRGPALLGALAVLAGCASSPPVPVAPKDGELALPVDYKAWPRFLPTIDRPDVKQIRDIYMNPAATRVQTGQAFPQGSRFVMEIYAAATLPDGSLRQEGGRLVRGSLMHVYVMGKEAHWGGDIPEPQRNGNWIYSAYKPDGSSNTPIVNTCRGCHRPLKKDDYVIHMDRYFAQRKSALESGDLVAAAQSAFTAPPVALITARRP